MFWLATIELYLFIQNMLTPMGDHIIWKLRFESSEETLVFPGKVGLVSQKHLKTVLIRSTTLFFRSSNRRNAVRAPRRPPWIFRESLRFYPGQGSFFTLQEC